MIEKGNVVDVHYTGKFTNGEVFDSSRDREVLTFTIGSGQIISGFENAIIGKNKGESVTVNIDPSNAYGEVKEDLFVRIENRQLPGDVTVGQILQAESDSGIPVTVVVKEIFEDHVIIDGNHPLAGKELIFDIEVVDVK